MNENRGAESWVRLRSGIARLDLCVEMQAGEVAVEADGKSIFMRLLPAAMESGTRVFCFAIRFGGGK